MRRKLHAATAIGLPVCGAVGACFYAADPSKVSCQRCLRSERAVLEGSPVRSDPDSPGDAEVLG